MGHISAPVPFSFNVENGCVAADLQNVANHSEAVMSEPLRRRHRKRHVFVYSSFKVFLVRCGRILVEFIINFLETTFKINKRNKNLPSFVRVLHKTKSEMRQFHLVVVCCRRLTNVQKWWCTYSVFFLIINQLFSFFLI